MKPALPLLLAAVTVTLTACSTGAPVTVRTIVVTVRPSVSATPTPTPIDVGSYYLDSVCPQNQEDRVVRDALTVSTLGNLQKYAQTDEAFAVAALHRLTDPSVEFPPSTRKDLTALVKHLQAKKTYLGTVAAATSLTAARAAKVPTVPPNTFRAVRAALGLSENTITSCAPHVGAADTGAVAAPKPTPTPTPVPVEYLTALASAQDYDSTDPMSKKGLYQQLTSSYGEGFSKKAGKYAVDHVKANWNKNALKSARDYRSEEHLSTAGIREQLTFSYGEQYTESQADYAIKHLND